MDRTDAIAWVLSVCADTLRLSQVKTLSQLVAAALEVERVSLSAIGRKMLGAVKHQIKRTWRFCANERIETSDAMKGVVAELVKRRKKRLLVCFDWTDLRGFQTLMAAAVIHGRAVPLCWASCFKNVFDGYKSRNSLEESLLLVLRSMIPQSVQVVILADRGFGRTELARFCQHYHFSHVIRVKPEVWVKSREFEGQLLDYPVYKGIAKLLKSVQYRQKNPVTLNVVIRWMKNLPKRRDECWFLITDLNATPQRLCQLYRRRMTIEELFRDEKNKRHGWSLRDTQITRPDRIDRLLLILALAYLLLVGIGLKARQRYRPSDWCSSTSDKACGVFFIGRVMRTRMRLTARQAFAAVIAATVEAIPNWG